METTSRPHQATTPFSIRLTEAERADLEARAGARPVGTYVKSVLFDGKGREVRKSPRVASRNQQELGRLLAALGASRMASNLNQLAKASNQGALPLTEEVEAELRAACAHVAEMRSQLLLALGVETTGAMPAKESVSATFNARAGARR